MRILGPGDILSFGAAAPSMILVERGCRVVAPAQLALLGKDVLVGAHRWPRLTAGLHVRTAEQIERVAVQLAICQLPRVEDRLLALLWLLAESWGRVTPSGTALPINLTHETLGALVGARRPTVTLALGELTSRGAVLRQGRTWLLLERPPTPNGSPRAPHAPELVAEQSSHVGAARRRRRPHGGGARGDRGDGPAPAQGARRERGAPAAAPGGDPRRARAQPAATRQGPRRQAGQASTGSIMTMTPVTSPSFIG